MKKEHSSLYRLTHTHTHTQPTERDAFHISIRSRECSKAENVRNGEARDVFSSSSFTRWDFLLEVFLFYRLKKLISSTVVGNAFCRFEVTFWYELISRCGSSTAFNRLSLSATQQEIKNSISFFVAVHRLIVKPKHWCRLARMTGGGGCECTGEISIERICCMLWKAFRRALRGRIVG